MESDWMGMPEDEELNDYEGFVYMIVNLNNGRRYIGKKFLWKVIKQKSLVGRSVKEKLKRSKLKGNKRHKKVFSDWKTYWGSCNELSLDIDKSGKNNFRRFVLVLCKTKWDTSYTELKFQVQENVLVNPLFYNGIIQCRLRGMKKRIYEVNKIKNE